MWHYAFRSTSPRIALMLAGVLLAAAMLAGCSADDSTVDNRSYGDDGYMGLANAHPGILTNPRSRTYAADSRMMQKALSGVQGIERSRFMFNGGRVLVRLRVKEGLSASEREEIRLQTERILREAAPRYTVKVRLDQ